MLNFGKYKGYILDDITDINYIKYLSDYDFYVHCEVKDSEDDHECGTYCSFKIIIQDKSEILLDSYLSSEHYYINKYPNYKLWSQLFSTNNKIEQIGIIFKNKEYFNNININPIMKVYDDDMSIFYLRLYHEDVINQVRDYLKNNRLCIFCINKLKPTNYLFHKKCYNYILKEY